MGKFNYHTFIIIDDHSIRQIIVDNTVSLSRGGEVQVESFTSLNNGVTHYRHRSTLHCVSRRWVGETEGQCRSNIVQSICWEVLNIVCNDTEYRFTEAVVTVTCKSHNACMHA